MQLFTDVSSTVLILAISRFSSRRGVPKLFVSDNFKPFKSIELKNFLFKSGIKWQFILEKSPWWSRFYERLVGIVKNSLKKVIGKEFCNYEQLTTYLCEIEKAINQRTLTYVADENYENLLTPYRMIFGRNIDDNCTTDFYKITRDNVRANFSMQRKLLSVFKKRFEAWYITALQEKHIYNRPRFLQDNSIIVGDVVLLKEESISRMKWREENIIELICGNDGKIRGVKLNVYQTKLKETVVINQPLQLIVSYEIANEPSEPAETIALSKPRRDAAETADAIRLMIPN